MVARSSGKIRFILDHPTRRNLYELHISAPTVGARWEVARRLILRHEIPLRRIGWKARSHDDPISEGKSSTPAPRILDVTVLRRTYFRLKLADMAGDSNFSLECSNASRRENNHAGAKAN